MNPVHKYISNSDIGSAINYIIDYFQFTKNEIEDKDFNTAVMLSNQYNRLREDMIKGIVSRDDYWIESNKLCDRILVFSNGIENEIRLFYEDFHSKKQDVHVRQEVVMSISNCTFGHENMYRVAVNANIYRGDIIGVIGINGAGKSTFINTISKDINLLNGDIDFISSSKGNAIIEAASFAKLSTTTSIWPYGIEDTLKFLIRNRSGLGEKEATKFLNYLSSRLSIQSLINRPYEDLSEGQKTMIDIAKIFAGKASVVLLDEPLSHLDPNKRATVLEDVVSLINLSKVNFSLISAFSFKEIKSIVNRVFVLHNESFFSIKVSDLKKIDYHTLSFDLTEEIDLDFIKNTLIDFRISNYVLSSDLRGGKIIFKDSKLSVVHDVVRKIVSKHPIFEISIDDFDSNDLKYIYYYGK